MFQQWIETSSISVPQTMPVTCSLDLLSSATKYQIPNHCLYYTAMIMKMAMKNKDGHSHPFTKVPGVSEYLIATG
jgi:hypothetical protein